MVQNTKECSTMDAFDSVLSFRNCSRSCRRAREIFERHGEGTINDHVPACVHLADLGGSREKKVQ